MSTRGRPKSVKTLLGDSGGGNLRDLLDRTITQIGGPEKVAEHLAKYINDPNAGAYDRARAFQMLTKMMGAVDKQLSDGIGNLNDAEIEDELTGFAVRFLVQMPETMYGKLIGSVDARRKLLADRAEQAKVVREKYDRPVGDTVAGIPVLPKPV